MVKYGTSADGLGLDQFLEHETSDKASNGQLDDPFEDSYDHPPSPQVTIRERQAPSDNGYVNSPSRQVSIVDRPRPAPRHDVSGQSRVSGGARFVLAIDYGTTYTGVAFATTYSETADPKKIEVLQDWTSTMSNQEKVRSMYSYADPNKAQWGTDISDDSVAIVNTKLELEPRETRIDELESTLNLLRGTKYLSFANVRACGPKPAFTPNSPTTIVMDYLTKIRECACNDNNIDIAQLVRTKTPVDLVITVPANWSYEAKNATFQAFRGAGFDSTVFPTLEDTILVPEPEAASYFTARDLQEEGISFLEVDQCYVLCDAGGGTVDVVSYRVARSDATLELQKATAPKSGRCGSVFIDLAFKRWLREMIGLENYNSLDPSAPANGRHRIYPYAAESGSLRELIKRFEVKKKAFSNSNQDIKLDLPEPLNRLNIEGRVSEGELTISCDEMTHLFSPCVNGAIKLIQDQIDQLRISENRRVKSVILVGGFGASPYLQQQLKRSLDLRKIKMQRPDVSTSWTAVVRGAVIYGIEKYRHRDAEYMSAITRSYGVMMKCPHGQFEWLIRKGDLVLRTETRTVTSRMFWVEPRVYMPTGRFDLPVYVYLGHDDDDVPERWEDGQHEVKDILQVSCNVSNIRSRSMRQTQPYPRESVRESTKLGPFTCRMQLVGTLLKVVVHMNSIVVGHAEMQVELDHGHSHTTEFWQDAEV